jgi:DNA-binding FadR family transcriptional regulator
VAKRGACAIALEHLAPLAGVGRSSVKNALRRAHALGLIRIEERRLTASRNLSKQVTIVSPEWSTRLRMARKRTFSDAEALPEIGPDAASR